MIVWKASYAFVTDRFVSFTKSAFLLNFFLKLPVLLCSRLHPSCIFQVTAIVLVSTVSLHLHLAMPGAIIFYLHLLTTALVSILYQNSLLITFEYFRFVFQALSRLSIYVNN